MVRGFYNDMLYTVRRVTLRVVLVLMSGCLPNILIASEQPARETEANPAAQSVRGFKSKLPTPAEHEETVSAETPSEKARREALKNLSDEELNRLIAESETSSVQSAQASQPAVAHEVNPPPALSTEKTDAPSSGANPVVSSSENAEIGGPVRVLEFVLSTQVEGREPKNIVENFEHANGMAYAFARLSALKNSEITFIWRREGTVQSRFTTTVHASKKWRTFSSVKLRPGHWTVQLLLGQTMLAEKAFTVE